MKKELTEMTLKELWELFPIFLTEHNSNWNQWFTEESERLQKFLPAGSVSRISHIGSTAVVCIRSKPIIDILAETGNDIDTAQIIKAVIQSGYTLMSSCETRFSFNR